MDNRKRMGKDKEGVIFPIAPYLSEMGDCYLRFIEEIKQEIQKQRVAVVMNANAGMICLYWNMAISNICVSLPSAGRIMKLCNGALHKWREWDAG